MSDMQINAAVVSEVIAERTAAHAKHGINSLEAGKRLYHFRDSARGHHEDLLPEEREWMTEDESDGVIFADPPHWDGKQLRILLEEVGEVAKAMNEFALQNISPWEYESELRKELIQVMGVSWAWIDKIDSLRLTRDDFPHGHPELDQHDGEDG